MYEDSTAYISIHRRYTVPTMSRRQRIQINRALWPQSHPSDDSPRCKLFLSRGLPLLLMLLLVLNLYGNDVNSLKNSSAASEESTTQKPVIEEDERFQKCPEEPILHNETDGKIIYTSTRPSVQMSLHDPTVDKGVSGVIDEKGCYECHMIEGLQAIMTRYPDAWFIDIGANIGMWSLVIAARKHDTLAIEAFPTNVDKLCESIPLNPQLREYIHVLPMALVKGTENSVDVDTTVNFKMSERSNYGSVRGFKSSRAPGTINVPATSLDSLLLSQDRPILKTTDRPVAIKIDIEGMEFEALQGGIKFLKQADILFVAMEVRTIHLHQHEGEARRIFDILAAKGLKPYRQDKAFYGHTETQLNPSKISEWKHERHPRIRIFDVVWRK